MRFKVGDKVVRTKWCSDDYTVKQGGEYVISKVDDECNSIYLQGVYDDNGQPDWFSPDNYELVEGVSVPDVEDTSTQDKEGYNSMTPDTLIPISIDGNDFEVSLGGLLLARYILGKANGSYIYSLYCALDVIDKEYQVGHFESQNPLDCSEYENDLFSKYFKDKVKESKKLEIKAQIESLQEQLKTLD